MIERTEENIQLLLAELKTHPALTSFSEFAPVIWEFSPKALHFSACETATNRLVRIKVNVTESEIYWTTHLPPVAPTLFPHVFATGSLPAKGQVGFIVQETLPYTLIGTHWEGRQVDLVLDAAAQFHQAALSVTPRHIPALSLNDHQRWLAEGSQRNPPGNWQHVLACTEQDYAWLVNTFPFEVCHGDLHVGNALSWHTPPQGPALLIDLNPILQPWVFDSAWVEVCNWGEQAKRGVGHATRYLAERRRELGLDVPEAKILEKAERIALSWIAIRFWNPDHLEFMPGFEQAIRTHIERGASLPR